MAGRSRRLRRSASLFLLAGALSSAACASHAARPWAHPTPFAGLPVYPNAALVGAARSGDLALYRSRDDYTAIADWYAGHMPAATHAARDDKRSRATYSVFLSAETKTVHVEVADGTVWITMTDVKSPARPVPTGR